MRRVRQPIVAAINGSAVGAGFALALASDIRIAADDAMLQNAFSDVGLSGCDFGVSYLLPRLVGSAAAAEIMLTAERLTAERAAALGLVSRVVPLESLIGEALDVARAIASKSPLGVQQTKRVLDANLGASDLYSAQQLENRTQVAAILGGDFNEAVAAFIERRPPAFSLIEADR
jgi:enoyl-CoA hydratase